MRNLQTLILFILSIVSLCINCKKQDYPYKEILESFSDEELLEIVQKQTFRYFWDFAEPNSGLARERYHPDGIYPENDENIVTTGGTGFGLMSIISAIDRGFVDRDQALKRLNNIADFLENSDRFYGVWSHWIDGRTGKTKPFSVKDDGGDLVETAFLAQGFIVVREYLKNSSKLAEIDLAKKYDNLWRSIQWNWYTKGEDVLYWHWSPNYNWEMNQKIEGYNECLITYVLAASSPTYSISKDVYDRGWAGRGGIISKNMAYNFPLILKHNGAEKYGGPLFWAHYSFLGLNPKGLKDKYADYWSMNYNHTMINYNYCIENPNKFKNYGKNLWGLTASYSRNKDGTTGYNIHFPENDVGVISPTAAISSIVYSPKESIEFIRNIYENYPNYWGEAGFYDAISPHYDWVSNRYLAIDQGTQVVMIENFRSGLIWDLFMNAPDIKRGLEKLDFISNHY